MYAMDIDWTKQFEKVSIPYADEFVNNYHYNKRIENANKKLNFTYKNCIRQSQVILKFSDDVVYFGITNESSE